MLHRSIALPLAALLSLVLVACTGASTPTPQVASPGASATSAPVSEAPASDAPASEAPATDGPEGTVPNISITPDVPLEDMFPDDIGGQPLEVESATGQSILTLFGESDPTEINEFLAGYGKTLDDASAAIAFSFIPGATATEVTGISILALRVRGVAGTDLRNGFAAIVAEDAPGSTITEATVAGKSVVQVAEPPEDGEPGATPDPERTVNLYAVGDVIFMVGGTLSLVEEAFTKLP